jgi:hypothetical protein
MWVTDHIFKIDKLIFRRLLCICAINCDLFHRQGNFPSHGFSELRPVYGLVDLGLDRVRLPYHRDRLFVKGCSEEAISRCK